VLVCYSHNTMQHKHDITPYSPYPSFFTLYIFQL